MTPEMLFALAIIGAIGTSITGIVVGVVSLLTSRNAKSDAQTAKVTADKKTDDIKTDVDDLSKTMLEMVDGLSDQLTRALELQNGDLRKTVENQGKQLTSVLESQHQIIKNDALVREENAGFRRDIEVSKQLISDVQEENRVIKNELTSQKNYSKTLEVELDKAKRAYEQTIQTTANQLNDAKSELQRLMNENAGLREQVRDIADLTDRVAKLEQEVQTMTEERQQFIRRINELETQRDSALQRAEIAERERDELKAQLETEKKRGTRSLVSQAVGDPIDTPRVVDVINKQIHLPTPITAAPVEPLITPPAVHDTQQLPVTPATGDTPHA